MPKTIKYLRLAQEISKQSTSIQQRMCAITVRGGKIITVGVNRNFSHAETRALRPHMDLRGCDIYIARRNFRISRPCSECQKKIIKAGIRRAIYIALDGTIVTETFKEA